MTLIILETGWMWDVVAGVVEAKRSAQVRGGLDVGAGSRLKCAEVAGGGERRSR